MNAPGNSGESEDSIEIAARLLLDERGNPLQSLLLEESARAADAAARELAHRLDQVLVSAGPVGRALDPLGFWPVARELLRKEPEDEEVLATVRSLIEATQPDGGSGAGAATAQGIRAAQGLDPAVSRKIAEEVWRNRAGAGALGVRLAARILLRASERLGRISDEKQDTSGSGTTSAIDPLVSAWASVGKAATSLSAAQLAAASRVDLNDPSPAPHQVPNEDTNAMGIRSTPRGHDEQRSGSSASRPAKHHDGASESRSIRPQGFPGFNKQRELPPGTSPPQ